MSGEQMTGEPQGAQAPAGTAPAEAGSDPDVLELELGKVAHGGFTVARHEGRVVFVRHGAPGERVLARLDPGSEGSDRFWRADVVKVLRPSPHRRPHDWPAADATAAPGRSDEAPDGERASAAQGSPVVGGAEFGHLDLPYQRELKSRVLAEQLQRLAGIDLAGPDGARLGYAGVEPAHGESEDGLGWRTRAAFAVDEHGRLAMRAARSHRTVATPSMPLAVPAINELGLGDLDLTGLARVEVAAPAAGGAPLVLLVPEQSAEAAPPGPQETGKARRGRRSRARQAAHRVVQHVGTRAGVALLGQVGGAASDGAGKLEVLSGNGWVEEQVAGNTYRVSGEGFWQVHRAAPETLLAEVLAAAEPAPGERWADLYAGAGLFSLPLALAVGDSGEVVSIEGAPGTHRDARANLQGLAQARAVRGRVERTLAQHSGGRGFDGVVLDPPRAGAKKQAVRAIAAAAPSRIVYVSCDPASFARDVADFRGHGYELTRLRAFDLYPHTHHLETVGTLRPLRG